ncbi:MAG: TetR/AcrR family transcriptional regulator [Ruminococcus sp.]|nr:TetR/AcrR family transcriptional regulator [Ruminococcus sp.]
MKEDQRTRLSKQMLRNALIELLKEKSINKIFVREICSKAEINRTTFYKYYGRPYDLMKDIENTLYEELSHEVGDSKSCLMQTMRFIDKNADTFRLLEKNNVDPMFPQKIQNIPEIKEILEGVSKSEKFSGFGSYAYEFIVSGGYGVVRNWLNKERRESPEEIAEYLYTLFYSIK